MTDTAKEKEVLDRLTAWADRRPDVRALFLTSSRAGTGAATDAFSDYDVILAVNDIQPYLDDEGWLEDFGKVLVVYRDPVQSEYGFEKFIRVTQYEDGLKIDFSVWPTGLIQKIANEPELPDYIDDGYKVLLDKDMMTSGMKAPSGKAFIPRPPTEAEFRYFVEGFFSNAPYAAKHIRRNDFFPLTLMLNYMRYEKLRKMLEWRVEIEHGWSIQFGNYGKGLTGYLDSEIIKELENTVAGPGPEADWELLFRIIKIFRKIAKKVGKSLGYTYPDALDRRVVRYLQKVRESVIPED